MLDSESFKPQMFVSYLRLLNEANEMQLDCADALQTLFRTGERIPDWAALDTERKDEESGKTFMTDLGSLDVRKVIVMDPPPMITEELPLQGEYLGGASDAQPENYEMTSSKFMASYSYDASLTTPKNAVGMSNIMMGSQKAIVVSPIKQNSLMPEGSSLKGLEPFDDENGTLVR